LKDIIRLRYDFSSCWGIWTGNTEPAPLGQGARAHGGWVPMAGVGCMGPWNPDPSPHLRGPGGRFGGGSPSRSALLELWPGWFPGLRGPRAIPQPPGVCTGLVSFEESDVSVGASDPPGDGRGATISAERGEGPQRSHSTTVIAARIPSRTAENPTCPWDAPH
jgi:hypothetical protein